MKAQFDENELQHMIVITSDGSVRMLKSTVKKARQMPDARMIELYDLYADDYIPALERRGRDWVITGSSFLCD